MDKDFITSILEREAEAVRHIPVSEHYEQAIDLIVEHVHDRGGKPRRRCELLDAISLLSPG